MGIEENGKNVPRSVDHVFRTFKRSLSGTVGKGADRGPVVEMRKKRTIQGHGDILGYTDKSTGQIDLKESLKQPLLRETQIHELCHYHWPDATEDDVTESARRIHNQLGPRRRGYLDSFLEDSQ